MIFRIRNSSSQNAASNASTIILTVPPGCRRVLKGMPDAKSSCEYLTLQVGGEP